MFVLISRHKLQNGLNLHKLAPTQSSPTLLYCSPLPSSIFHRREKALEGKSKVSHSVHSPYFTDDKQEFWWCYISDRKNHALVTPPIHVTGLVEREEVELKFTAPAKPGM